MATVLVVEDDPALRMLCRVNLELENYRVLEAATVDLAGELLARSGQPRAARPARRQQRRARARPDHPGAAAGRVDLPAQRHVGRAIRRSTRASTTSSASRSTSTSSGPRSSASARALSGSDQDIVDNIKLGGYIAKSERGDGSHPCGVRGAPAGSTSSSAPRRCARYESARRRSPSAPRSSRATPTSSTASSSTRCAPPRRGPTGTSASGSSACARRARAASPTRSSSEREDELENAILAARVTFQGEEMPLRTAQAKLAVLPDYAERDELGRAPGGRDRRRSTTTGASCSATRTRSRPSSRESPDPVARNEEEKGISLRELSRTAQQASDDVADALRGAARPLVRAAARRRARAEVPSAFHIVLHAAALAARGDVHEGARGRGLPGDARRSSASTSRTTPNIRLDLDDRPQKSPRACVIAARPAEGRPPDHARAGRAPRLPGVPARGRARAPLRAAATRASRTRSATSRATTR